MNEERAPEYVESRRALLDALEQLGEHRGSIVVAGAQAVYLRTGDSSYPGSLQPYTTDADIALDPSSLRDHPEIREAMTSAGFSLKGGTGREDPGVWERAAPRIGGSVVVDLIVPEAIAPPGGRRGARLGAHGKRAARKVRGLEAVVVDNTLMAVGSLDPADTRVFEIKVAGSAALFVAKMHKITDRLEDEGRSSNKDVGDLYRLFGATPAADLARSIRGLLEDERSEDVTRQALREASELFRAPNSPGVQMGAAALSPAVPEDTVGAVLIAYVKRLGELLEP